MNRLSEICDEILRLDGGNYGKAFFDKTKAIAKAAKVMASFIEGCELHNEFWISPKDVLTEVGRILDVR